MRKFLEQKPLRTICQLLLFVTFAVHLAGCASFGRAMKSLVGGSDSSRSPASQKRMKRVGKIKKKKYRKVTKKSLEDSSEPVSYTHLTLPTKA